MSQPQPDTARKSQPAAGEPSAARLTLRWFRLVWRGRGWMLARILLLSVVNAVLATAFPWLWQYLVDGLATDEGPSLLQMGGWLLAIGLSQTLLYAVLQGSRTVMNGHIERTARDHLFARLAEQDHAFYRRWRAGDLVTRLTDDGGEKISWFLCSGLFRATEALLIVLAALGAMLWIDWKLALMVLTPLPLLLLGQARAQTVLAARFARVQGAISHINDDLTTTFAGIRIVQAAGLGPMLRRRFARSAESQRDAEIDAARVQRAIYSMYGYGWQLALAALLLAGGIRVIEGDLSPGQYVAFEGFVTTLVWPMFDFGTLVSKFYQASAALRRLQQLMDEPLPQAPAGDQHATQPALALTGGAAHVGETPLIQDVDLSVAPGELVAVVGTVASGKSSLLGLLAGAWPVSGGRYEIGGAEHHRLPAGERRGLVAYVPQDPVLLSAPLRDNILLGRSVAADQLQRALTLSRLEADLPQLPDGLDTLVGERGVTLSGGQQQRVALARALVGTPGVLLLDDATAALDADTEEAFWSGLESIRADLAMVVVTHRPATIERADEVLVLDQGRVVQRGTHASLLAHDGPYQRIYGRYRARVALEG